MTSRFELKDLGETSSYLGLGITTMEDSTLSVSQSRYISSILQDFNLENAHSVTTPLPESITIDDHPLPERETGFSVKRYQHGIGCLQHLVTMTRPDIARAVGILSQFNSKPTPKCFDGLLHVLKYLKSTINFSLKYPPAERLHRSIPELSDFSDSDWAGPHKTMRKSTSGYVFTVNNSPNSWRSAKQSCITLSSNEAEYVSLSDAAREAVWLRNLLSDLGVIINEPVPIHLDSNGASELVKIDGQTPRSKHTDVRFHYSRELYKSGLIALLHVNSKDNMADLLTKLFTAKSHHEQQ